MDGFKPIPEVSKTGCLFILFCMVIGFIAIAYGIVYGVMWLITHVNFQ